VSHDLIDIIIIIIRVVGIIIQDSLCINIKKNMIIIIVRHYFVVAGSSHYNEVHIGDL